MSLQETRRWNTTCLGEPLNVIVSANSDSYVLTDWGFRNYMRWAASYIRPL